LDQLLCIAISDGYAFSTIPRSHELPKLRGQLPSIQSNTSVRVDRVSHTVSCALYQSYGEQRGDASKNARKRKRAYVYS